jgi:hypothetical protein
MLIECYLREGIVYVPTVARRASSPIYTTIEPIAVVRLNDLDAVRTSLVDALERGNAIISDPDPQALRAPPIILKYARVRSWAAFFRTAWSWSITQEDGAYQILGYRKHPKGYWEEDQSQKIQFRPQASRDDVVDRMIAILQKTARAAPTASY